MLFTRVNCSSENALIIYLSTLDPGVCVCVFEIVANTYFYDFYLKNTKFNKNVNCF